MRMKLEYRAQLLAQSNSNLFLIARDKAFTAFVYCMWIANAVAAEEHTQLFVNRQANKSADPNDVGMLICIMLLVNLQLFTFFLFSYISVASQILI